MKRYITCMTIAGSDPSGGAGIQADLKAFGALGCYGQAVVTTLTVQNTEGVLSSHPVEPALVREQIEAVWTDWMPDAVKIGITPSAEVMKTVSELIDKYRPLFTVLDPVMISSSGRRLMDAESVDCMRNELMPRCSLVTPNLPEAEVLLSAKYSDSRALLAAFTERFEGVNVLLKGGHADGRPTDWLAANGGVWHFEAERIASNNTHGTGCVLSSAIAAYMAHGLDLPVAVRCAKKYLTQALESGKDFVTGHGHGPLNHFFAPEKAHFEEF